MRHGRVGAVLVAAFCAGAFADDVVLKSGRTLSGAIVKEDDAKIVLSVRGGSMTISKDDVQSIKRGPPPAGTDAPPPAPPAPPAKKPSKEAPATKPAEPKKPQQPTSGKRARDVLAELQAIQLAPWGDKPCERATDHPTKNYKVIGNDGRTTMRDDRPTSPEGIAELYHLQDSSDGHYVTYVNGEELFYWFRLYWHDDAKGWTVNSPELDAFQKDCAWARRVADMCCKDVNGLVASSVDERDLEQGLGKQGSEAAAAKAREKLRQDCVAATGAADSGELLAQARELEAEIVFANPTTEKIKLAMKRREVLARLVQTLGN